MNQSKMVKEENIDVNFLRNILVDYHIRKDKLKKPFIDILHYDEGIPPKIHQGFRSKIYRLPTVDYKVRTEGGEVSDYSTKLCLKVSGEGRAKVLGVKLKPKPIFDSAKTKDTSERCLLEAQILKELTEQTWKDNFEWIIPEYYWHDGTPGKNGSGKIRIITNDLGDKVIGKDCRKLNSAAIYILGHIADKSPSITELGIEHSKDNIDIYVPKLERLGFVEAFKKDDKTCFGTTSKFKLRFKFNREGGVTETNKYLQLRDKLAEEMTNTIFKLHDKGIKVGSGVLTDLGIFRSEQSRTRYVKMFKQKLDSFIRYKFGEDKAKKFLDDETLHQSYLQEFCGILDNESKNLIFGTHPNNMMYEIENGKPKAYIIDLDHPSFGPWASDITDSLNYLFLRCELSPQNYDTILSNIFKKRLEKGYKGESLDSLKKLKSILDIHRTIYVLGSRAAEDINYNLDPSESHEIKVETETYRQFLIDTLNKKEVGSEELRNRIGEYIS